MTSRLPVRTVVDTNVLFSGLISTRGAPFEILELWHAAQIRLVVSEVVVAEYRRIFARPDFAARFASTPGNMGAFFDRLSNAEIVHVDTSLERSLNCRDSKDIKFLAVAVAGAVPFLISGDDDILACAGDPALGSVQIVRPREFLQRFDEPS